MVAVSQKVIIHQCLSVLKIIQSCSFFTNGPLLYKLQAIIDILAHQLAQNTPVIVLTGSLHKFKSKQFSIYLQKLSIFAIKYLCLSNEKCLFLFQVKKWLTLNEPWVCSRQGYDDGSYAPGNYWELIGNSSGTIFVCFCAPPTTQFRISTFINSIHYVKGEKLWPDWDSIQGPFADRANTLPLSYPVISPTTFHLKPTQVT